MADAISVSLNEYVVRHDPVERAARAARRKATKFSITFAKSLVQTTNQNAESPVNPEQSPTAISTEQTTISLVQTTDLRELMTIAKDEAHAKISVQNALVQTTKSLGRKRFTAAETHAVHIKTGGRCCLIDRNGKRCDCDRWLHIHHLIPVSMGGTNDIDNLIHLCWAHHDLVHQEVMPLDDQVTWWTFDV